MASSKRVVTANLPGKLVDELDRISREMDRSKSWIIRKALGDWLAEQHRRYQLTLDALANVDEGRVYTHDEILAWAATRKDVGDPRPGRL